jgi:hypothetical protein
MSPRKKIGEWRIYVMIQCAQEKQEEHSSTHKHTTNHVYTRLVNTCTRAAADRSLRYVRDDKRMSAHRAGKHWNTFIALSYFNRGPKYGLL